MSRPKRCPLYQCPLQEQWRKDLIQARSAASNAKRWRQRWMYEPTFPFKKKPEYRRPEGTA